MRKSAVLCGKGMPLQGSTFLIKGFIFIRKNYSNVDKKQVVFGATVK